MRKPAFCICENKYADQLRSNREAAFVFATLIVQSLYLLNTKFQTSSQFVWSYSLVCLGPGRKPRRPVFSQQVVMNHFSSKMLIERFKPDNSFTRKLSDDKI